MTDTGGIRQGLVEALILHESALGRLYRTFSSLFERRRDFWLLLSREEQRHAQLLQGLSADGAIAVERSLLERGVKEQAVRSSLAYVEERRTTAEKGSIDLLHALSLAHDLESALVEQWFAHLDAASCLGAMAVLLELAEDTRRHRELIAEALERERVQA